MKRWRVRTMAKVYTDAGPDLLRPEDNATRQLGTNMGKAKDGFFVRVNPPTDRTPWGDWSKVMNRAETLRRVDTWQHKAGDGSKLQVGRKVSGKIEPKHELLTVVVKEARLPQVNPGAQLIADLFRTQFPGKPVYGFTCREYNGIPGSGWSDHAWGDAVDLDVNGGSPGPNDKLTDWCVRMGQAGCWSPAQFIGSNGGKVYSYYASGYKPVAGGPESHKTHVHCSFRQHYGANPHCS